MTSDRIRNIGIENLYRGVDMTRDLILNDMMQSYEDVYPVDPRLGYLPIEGRIAIPWHEVNDVLQGLHQYDLVYRCDDGRFDITEQGKMELRRN